LYPIAPELIFAGDRVGVAQYMEQKHHEDALYWGYINVDPIELEGTGYLANQIMEF